jgi:hypothetical protein
MSYASRNISYHTCAQCVNAKIWGELLPKLWAKAFEASLVDNAHI